MLFYVCMCTYAGVKACLLISRVLDQTVLCEQKMAKIKINKGKTKRVDLKKKKKVGLRGKDTKFME